MCALHFVKVSPIPGRPAQFCTSSERSVTLPRAPNQPKGSQGSQPSHALSPVLGWPCRGICRSVAPDWPWRKWRPRTHFCRHSRPVGTGPWFLWLSGLPERSWVLPSEPRTLPRHRPLQPQPPCLSSSRTADRVALARPRGQSLRQVVGGTGVEHRCGTARKGCRLPATLRTPGGEIPGVGVRVGGRGGGRGKPAIG